MKCLLLFQETSPALKNSMLCVWNGDYQLYFFFTIFIDRCSKLSYWQKETSTHIFRLWFDWWKCVRRPSSSESNFAFFVCLFVCLYVSFALFCFVLFYLKINLFQTLATTSGLSYTLVLPDFPYFWYCACTVNWW